VVVKAPGREQVTLVIVDSRDLSALRSDTPSALRSVRPYARTDSSAYSLNCGDNVAVQEAVQRRRRTAAMPGKSSLAVP
jgi:hypothetical protein